MDANTEFKDRKRFTYKADIYHDSLSSDVFYAATMHNFSKGGLYFESDHFLNIGDYINLRIKHPAQSSGKDNLYELGVEIIWRKKLRYPSFRYGYGAKFINSNATLESIVDTAELELQRSQNNDPKDEKDPREHSRRPYNKSLFFISNNQNYKGLITNISRGGAFIQTLVNFSVGQIIILVVPGHKGRKTLKLKGCIVRLNRNGVGVKFDRRKAVRNRRSDLDRRSGLDRRASRGMLRWLLEQSGCLDLWRARHNGSIGGTNSTKALRSLAISSPCLRGNLGIGCSFLATLAE